jgi:hypothetical protein
MVETRTLKVYGKLIRRFKSFRTNPEIRLTGNWLKRSGFECGNGITVTNSRTGELIIRTKKPIPIVYL